ncbi:transcriptional regulator with XRE-family HTH domain [Streptacidiphilus sp. MAP12-20]|uniref:helix-turn-helix domain-containing protein n=1 Tax=Streptacidiphilus sp. MAP12-20 TaxID=3156299 RepID=UPI003510D735
MGANWRPIPDDVRGTARRLTEELRGLKDRSGLSLTQIGTRTHYSKASWERWFNGKRLITEHALESLAVSVDESARALLPLLEQALLEAEQSAEPTPAGQRPAAAEAVAAPAATGASTAAPSPTARPLAAPTSASPSPASPPLATLLRDRWRRHYRSVLLAVTSALIGATGGAYLAAPSSNPTPQALGPGPVQHSATPGKSATPPPCDGVGCAGKDPQSTGCVTDSKSLVTTNVGKIVIYLHYSARCHAAWGGLTNAEPGDFATISTTAGDEQTAKVHWGFDNYSMMVDASDPAVGLRVCGYPPHGHGCTNTLSPPVAHS